MKSWHESCGAGRTTHADAHQPPVETDTIFPAEKRHETEVILKDVKLPYQINLYSGVEHGFAVRCDIKVPQQKYAKESAFLQACGWFEEHLK